MRYIKRVLLLVLISLIVLLVLRFTVFSLPFKFTLYKDVVVNKGQIKVTSELVGYKDSVLKIDYFIFDNKKEKRQVLPQEIYLIKKNQKVLINKEIPVLEDFFTNKDKIYLLVTVKDCVSNKKSSYEMPFLVSKTEEKNESVSVKESVVSQDNQNIQQEKVSLSQPTVAQKVSPQQTPVYKEKEKEVIAIEKKLVSESMTVPESQSKIIVKDEGTSKEVSKRESPYEVIISTENFLPEYFYGEIIESETKLVNNTEKVFKIKIDISLKDKNEIMISSRGITLSVNPRDSVETKIPFKIENFVIPSEYFLEYVYVLNNKKQLIRSITFRINDNPPKISLPELPVIKYKTTNTILAEISDDRGIKSVKFVEISKKGEEKVKQMLLIAGDSTFGLYSYTTEQILSKEDYKFYIQAQDNSGNISTTEIYNIKISK